MSVGPRFILVFGRLSLVIVSVLFLSACSSKSKSTRPIADGTCAQKIQLAKTALETALFEQLNSPVDPQRPSDIDAQPVYQLYRDALACDATSADANFGVAVVGLLALTSDPEVNAAFDEWKTYLAAHSPFEAAPTRARPLGVPISFTRGREALALPFDLVPLSVAALARPTLVTADPQISRVQDILENRVLPRLTQAIASLTIVAANPSYRFIVTPRMQGDEGAGAVEIDRADVLALQAACSLLAAACEVAVSYQLNFAAYDSTALYGALQPGSGWLALRAQGATHMGRAGADVLGAVNDLDASIASLLAETDSQDDDVIKIGPDSFSRADAESLRANLPNVRQALQAGFTLTEDWDGSPGTPNVPLTIRPGVLFGDPVPDWKALFPDYSASVTRRPAHQQFASDNGSQSVSVEPLDAGFYSADYQFSIDAGQPHESFFGDTLLRPALQQVVQDRYAAVSSIPGWAGGFSGYAFFYGNLTSGLQTISVAYSAYYSVATSFVFVPVITWDAGTFDAWTWPDPSLHGVLPQMTSTTQLCNTFGITASGWSKQVVLWSGSGPAAARTRRLP